MSNNVNIHLKELSDEELIVEYKETTELINILKPTRLTKFFFAIGLFELLVYIMTGELLIKGLLMLGGVISMMLILLTSLSASFTTSKAYRKKIVTEFRERNQLSTLNEIQSEFEYV